jgi:hypothetical protein
LQVFNHCQLEDPLIIKHHDPRGNLVKLRFDARTQSPLAGDQLVSAGRFPNEHRLEHAVLAQRIGEGRNVRCAEMPAGLEGIGVDLIDGDLKELGLFERAWLKSAVIAAQQCFEPASETSLIHGR